MSSIRARVLRTREEIDSIRDEWTAWHVHPNADPEFFSMIAGIRPEVVGPYIIALHRGDILETLIVARLERTELPLRVGYWNLGRVPVLSLSIVYGGVLGSLSPENCNAIVRRINESFREVGCHVAALHFVPAGSPLLAAWGSAFVLRRDHFPEARPHWVMKLPTDVDQIYARMSVKARKNRKYEARRFAKEFSGARIACYEHESDLQRVMSDSEEIARRTYQRGLGVGFEASSENSERLRLEMRRGRFRGYFLYVGDKPIAFFLGTFHKNVLYDNFSAFDPDYSKFSPGTYLFFQIFERACGSGVDSIDFGFGDAWYKAQFGTEKREEVSAYLFAPNSQAVAMNLIRSPAHFIDRLGKAAAAKVSFLGSMKKRLRDRAEKRVNE